MAIAECIPGNSKNPSQKFQASKPVLCFDIRNDPVFSLLIPLIPRIKSASEIGSKMKLDRNVAREKRTFEVPWVWTLAQLQKTLAEIFLVTLSKSKHLPIARGFLELIFFSGTLQ